MKTIIIVRHSKSCWDFNDLADIDRPVKPDRISDAYKMAGKLSQKKIIPELIISSPAIRALHTATIFTRELKIPASAIKINETLYFSDEDEILHEIYKIDDTISSVMIFGHNPTFTNFANIFVKKQIDNIPTSGFVLIKFDVKHWNEINKTNRVEEYFDYPKN
ncbi:MAG: hypothetical protein JXB17_07830 [Bacteroidales bacterium]|nr:hypothetical protein [Bacteroidales bacterium]